MTADLRPYQQRCVDDVMAHFDRRGKSNPLVVVPTGGGKSAILAGILAEAFKAHPACRALVLAHRKELLEQDARAILRFAPGLDVGVYSAGLGERRAHCAVVVGGIQSVARNLDAIGPRDLVVVDEAHLVPHGDDGADRAVLEHLGYPATVGLTATPFRLSGGHLCRGKGHLFSSVASEVTIAELLSLGHLAPLVSRPTAQAYSTGAVDVRGGEFVASQLGACLSAQRETTRAALREAAELAKGRKSWIVFCAGVDHAREAMEELFALGIGAAVVTGDTPSDERRATVEAFRRGDVRALVNVDVLTTGFDAPRVDCLVLLRPTASTGLYVQMCGRGMRPSPETGKVDCLVLDYGGNVERHGPVDHVRPKSQGASEKGVTSCEKCWAEVAARCAVCPECNALIAPRKCKSCGIEQRRDRAECADCGASMVESRAVEHDKSATSSNVMGERTQAELVPVREVRFSEHRKNIVDVTGNVAEVVSRTVRVDYEGGMRRICSEWVCPEHGGFAGRKAEKWWRERGGLMPSPRSVAEFLARAEDELHCVTAIRTAPDPQNEKYVRVVHFETTGAPVPRVEPPPMPEDAFDEWAAPAVADDEGLPF